MSRIEKTVFISYRRADLWPALAIFKDLTQHGYDAFIDYDGIGPGDFERAIVDNIRARAHFIVVLTPTALGRCGDPADWLRREIETAVAARRNVVPLLLGGFTFGAASAAGQIVGPLQALPRYQALDVPDNYFDAAMDRQRSRYLAVAVEAMILHPASAHARQVAQAQHEAAEKAPVGDEPFPSDPEGQLVLGDDYRLGRNGRPKDDAEAVKWYRKAAEQGNAAGQVNLGFMVEDGRGGLAKNDAEEVKWYRMAAEQGNAAGQANLGAMFYLGLGGLAKDYAEAAKWYRKAAEQGDATGQAYLASMYERGEGGLAKNMGRALELYRLAAAQGQAYANAALERLGYE